MHAGLYCQLPSAYDDAAHREGLPSLLIKCRRHASQAMRDVDGDESREALPASRFIMP